jgi:hypothetical protein
VQSDARPFQKVDTPEVTIGFDGHLLELRTKGVPSTEQGVTEAYGAIRSLTGGMVLPVLFDARGWPGGSPMAWMAAVHG